MSFPGFSCRSGSKVRSHIPSWAYAAFTNEINKNIFLVEKKKNGRKDFEKWYNHLENRYEDYLKSLEKEKPALSMKYFYINYRHHDDLMDSYQTYLRETRDLEQMSYDDWADDNILSKYDNYYLDAIEYNKNVDDALNMQHIDSKEEYLNRIRKENG